MVSLVLSFFFGAEYQRIKRLGFADDDLVSFIYSESTIELGESTGNMYVRFYGSPL